MIIDRVFIAVLQLSVSGMVFCVMFLPFEKLAFRLTSAKTMVAANTAALFSFLLPFYLIESLFLDKSEFVFQNYNVLIFEGRSTYDNAVAFVREWELVEHMRWLWLLGVALFSAYHLYSYLRLYQKIREGGFRLDDDEWGVCFERLKEENGLPDVELFGSCGIHTPCTMGFKNRYIIIPSGLLNAFDHEEIEFILRHEFYHLIHRDTLRMFLVTVLSAVNWFNPLFFFLKENLSAWQEIACDEEVTRGFSKKKRSQYCALTLKILEREVEPGGNKLFRLGFQEDSFQYHQRRLNEIMQKRGKNSIWGKAAVTSLVTLSMVLGNIAAKEADAPVNQIFSKNAVVVPSENISESRETDAVFDDFLPVSSGTTEKFVEFTPRDTENMTYHMICHDFEEALPRMPANMEQGHTHTIEPVTLEEHRKFSNGSCKTAYYEGRKCTSCGMLWKGDVIGAVMETNCPH